MKGVSFFLRKKFFGENTSSGTVSIGEKEGEANINAEQKDRDGHFSKDDVDNTTGTSEANW